MWAERLIRPSLFETICEKAPDDAQLSDGEVLLRTLAGGICGSDIPKFRGIKGDSFSGSDRFELGRPGFPLHEVVGEVVATRCQRIRVGQRVVGWATTSDGLREFVITKGDEVAAYGDELSPEDAVLVQSLACVLYAMKRLPVVNRRVAVLGLGPIGYLFAHVAKTQGARGVVGIDTVDRSGLAGSFGDVVTCASAEWCRSLAGEERPDVVIEAIGHQVSTLNDAIAAVGVGGTVLYFGIPDDDVYPINMEMVMRKNLTIIGGITRERQRSLQEAVDYLRAHPELITVLITHRFDRSGIQQAFDLAASPQLDRMKVTLRLDA